MYLLSGLCLFEVPFVLRHVLRNLNEFFSGDLWGYIYIKLVLVKQL